MDDESTKPIQITNMCVCRNAVLAACGEAGHSQVRAMTNILLHVEVVARSMFERHKGRTSARLKYPGTNVVMTLQLDKGSCDHKVNRVSGRIVSEYSFPCGQEQIQEIAEDHMLGGDSVKGLNDDIKITGLSKKLEQQLQEKLAAAAKASTPAPQADRRFDVV